MKILVLLFVLTSCHLFPKKSDLEFEAIPSGSRSNLSSQLSFKQLRKEVFEPHCIRCHFNYKKYNVVYRDRKKILDSISSNRMPKNAAPLDSELKELVEAWVENGAQNNGELPTSPSEPILKANWKSISENIIFPKCLQCHNPDGQASFLSLSKYEDFVDNADYLLNNFENVEQSYLVEVLTDPEEPMPPAWSNIERLTQKEIDVIKKWIENKIPKE